MCGNCGFIKYEICYLMILQVFCHEKMQVLILKGFALKHHKQRLCKLVERYIYKIKNERCFMRGFNRFLLCTLFEFMFLT